MSWGPIVWLKNQIEKIINDNTKWKFSNNYWSGTRVYLCKTNDSLCSPGSVRPNISGNVNPAELAGAFIPEYSGYCRVQITPTTLSKTVDVAIASEQEIRNALWAYQFQYVTIKKGSTDYIDDTDWAQFHRGLQEAINLKAVEVGYLGLAMDYLNTEALSAVDTTVSFEANCTKNVPMYFCVRNPASSGNATLYSNVEVSYSLPDMEYFGA